MSNKLLIVDDEVAHVDALCRTLEFEGWITAGFPSPRQALNRLRTESFDLILSDLMMPEMDGIALLRAAFEIDSNLVGILMTGHGTISTAVEALKAGVLDYVLKPLKVSTILPVLNRALSVRQLRMENIQLREAVGLYEVSMAIALASDSAAVLNTLAEAALKHTSARGVAVLMLTPGAQELQVVIVRGSVAFKPGTRVSVGHALTEWAARIPELLSGSPEPGREHGDVQWAFALPFLGGPTSLSIPLRSAGRLVGVLNIELGYVAQPLGLGRIKTVSMMANVAASALDAWSLDEQLRQSQKMEAVGRLTAGMAHDFNNLLTVINGHSGLLLRNSDSNDPSYRRLDEIRKAGESGAAMTRQLLAFSRKQVLQPEALNLAEALREMTPIIRSTVGETIEIVMRGTQADLQHVKLDRTQLQQIILNLAVNARDAMPHGGGLNFELTNTEMDASDAQTYRLREGRYVMVTVTDTGCGMPADVRERAFEPFFTTKDTGKGTGLGLATVYGIVQQSGGHVWLWSEPGQGTTFKLFFPAVEAEEREAGVETRAEAQESVNAGSETILVVEDDPGLRCLVEEVLSSEGYNVLMTGNGEQARRVAEEYAGDIHLLLSDLVLPDMSAREIASHVSRRRPSMQQLFMSGYTREAMLEGGILDNTANFIQKPWTPAGLSQMVRRVLDSRTPARATAAKQFSRGGCSM